MKLRNNGTFDMLLGQNFEFVRSLDVLLEVDFPILFSFDADDNKSYLAYVLNFKRRKKVLDILFVETNNQTLLDLLSEKMSLKQALTATTQKYITSEGVLDPTTEKLIDQLPDDDFYITELLPNRVDVLEKQMIFRERICANDPFTLEILGSHMFTNKSYTNYIVQTKEKINSVKGLPKEKSVEISIIPFKDSYESVSSEIKTTMRKKFRDDFILGSQSKVFDVKGE